MRTKSKQKHRIASHRMPLRFGHADKIVFREFGQCEQDETQDCAPKQKRKSERDEQRNRDRKATEIYNNCRLYSHTCLILLNNGCAGGNIHFTFHLSLNLIRPRHFSVFVPCFFQFILSLTLARTSCIWAAI